MRTETYEDIKRAYFFTLCLEVGTDREEHRNWDFMWSLHQKAFSWSVPNDHNRAGDGLHLRQVFADNMLSEEDCPCLDGECTILEMLVALAIRIEDILHIPNREDKTYIWFWEMIGNLELYQFKDTDTRKIEKIISNDMILDNLIERNYHPNGRGGLFPLRFPRHDQRKVELWYQMQAYLEENYPD